MKTEKRPPQYAANIISQLVEKKTHRLFSKLQDSTSDRSSFSRKGEHRNPMALGGLAMPWQAPLSEDAIKYSADGMFALWRTGEKQRYCPCFLNNSIYS